MDSQNFTKCPRLGLHFFPDSRHYRQVDLENWLPKLQHLGISWLTLIASPARAIPEFFLRALLAAGIEPVIHFIFRPELPVPVASLLPILNSYARWGVRYVVFFDRPNLRQSWSPAGWGQEDLPERFLDVYIPYAEAAIQAGLQPVFPALEPGGDYWDTAFLRLALQGLVRRKAARILDNFALGVHAWSGNRPLDWGAGGPERWPAARPYTRSPEVQNQAGFRIFDWYLPVIQAEAGEKCELLLLRAGSRPGDQQDPRFPPLDLETHARRNLSLIRWLEDDLPPAEAQEKDFLAAVSGAAPGMDPIPPEVIACNFWLLAAEPNTPYAEQAWFQHSGETLPIVRSLYSWLQTREQGKTSSQAQAVLAQAETGKGKVIAHYLLLPMYAWGAGAWDLEAIRPWLQRGRITVGFSIEEARLAEKVTILDGMGAIPESTVDNLRQSGCLVEVSNPSGTKIAS